MRTYDIREMMLDTLLLHGWTEKLAERVIDWRIAYARRKGLDITEFLQKGVYLNARQ